MRCIARRRSVFVLGVFGRSDNAARCRGCRRAPPGITGQPLGPGRTIPRPAGRDGGPAAPAPRGEPPAPRRAERHAAGGAGARRRCTGAAQARRPAGDMRGRGAEARRGGTAVPGRPGAATGTTGRPRQAAPRLRAPTGGPAASPSAPAPHAARGRRRQVGGLSAKHRARQRRRPPPARHPGSGRAAPQGVQRPRRRRTRMLASPRDSRSARTTATASRTMRPRSTARPCSPRSTRRACSRSISSSAET